MKAMIVSMVAATGLMIAGGVMAADMPDVAKKYGCTNCTFNRTLNEIPAGNPHYFLIFFFQIKSEIKVFFLSHKDILGIMIE